MSKWALILGGSTGHGAATAKKLASEGYGIIAFHFDRGETKKIAEENIKAISEMTNDNCHYFNTNAAAIETIEKFVPQIKEITNGQPLKLLLHSIAFGTTTNFFGEKPVTQRQMDMTIHVMSNCLLYWTQKLYDAKMLASGSRVLGLTSEGNYVAMEGNSWACSQEKYIGYVNMDYKTSTKTIEICTCVDSPCSDNSNIEKYETQWE